MFIQDNFLDDNLIPTIFITDYMSDLSLPAIKVYLMSLVLKDADNVVISEQVKKPLSLSKDDLKAALVELANHKIIKCTNDLSKYKLLNLKKQVIDEYYRRRTSKPMKTTVQNNARHKEREELLNSLNNSFFSGAMGPKWYQTIDGWFTDYDFDADVVYQMISDGAQRNVLATPNYLNAVADNYASHNIKSFNDLKKYKENYKKVNVLAKKISRQLNKNISRYDLNLIEKWYNEFGYDYDVIEVALRAAVRLSEPNLNYFDSILTNWHKAGINSKKEAEQVFRNNRNHKNKRQYKKKNKNVEIDEREYSDEFYAGLYNIQPKKDRGDKDE